MVQILPHSLKEEYLLPAPWFQTCSFQNCGTVNFCCWSHPVCGVLLQQPELTVVPGAIRMWYLCGGGRGSLSSSLLTSSPGYPCPGSTVSGFPVSVDTQVWGQRFLLAFCVLFGDLEQVSVLCDPKSRWPKRLIQIYTMCYRRPVVLNLTSPLKQTPVFHSSMTHIALSLYFSFKMSIPLGKITD